MKTEVITHSPAPKSDGRRIEVTQSGVSLLLNDKEAVDLALMLIRVRYQVKIETWGHMAPEKGITYPIQMTAAVGYFNDDTLNPVLLSCGPEDGPWYGPWFYDAVREFLSERLGKDENSGKIFSFTGHWRNYRFVGKFKRIRMS